MLKISFRKKNNQISNIAPTKIVVLSFALLILAGTLLLMLPHASRSGRSAGFLDALFTATSATCVTGLIVKDAYTSWTLFGQLVILSLIQAGGLGVITLATFFSVLLGRKVGLRGMMLAQESINHFSFEGVLKLIKRVVLVTLSIEVIGALLLSTRFVPRFGPIGFYMGIFHAISSFCNAGFDLMSIAGKGEYMSLVGYNNDPVIIYTIAGLIVIGGLGFLVWKDLYEYRINKTLYLHTKVVLVMTSFLIVFGAVFFFISEYTNPLTLGNLNLFEKINAAVFQSVTPRTAGYNSIDQNGMFEISKVTTIILMFIGAAPGSTGGGVKVTTIGVILIAILSEIQGSHEIIIFKRRVHSFIVNKALAIIGLSGIWVIIVTTFILAREHTIPFINVLYEATSAFGTVGLSTGITPALHNFSKILLIITMFLGRVGPLSFAIALSLKVQEKPAGIVYPEGKIVVG
jgi:trk system potassium uptake protein